MRFKCQYTPKSGPEAEKIIPLPDPVIIYANESGILNVQFDDPVLGTNHCYLYSDCFSVFVQDDGDVSVRIMSWFQDENVKHPESEMRK
jgi:hypothetical protein